MKKMDRRDFIKVSGTAAAGMALGGCRTGVPERIARERGMYLGDAQVIHFR